MTVDREQTRRDARTRKTVHVLCNCECRHAQAGREAMRELDALLAELEQAERERDGERTRVNFLTSALAEAEEQLAKVPALVEALRILADAEAYSMRDEDHARYGFAHGPWYFNPETDDGDEAPWQIAQDALAAFEQEQKP